MTFLSTEKLVEALKWRYAVKKFDSSKKISAPTWEALEDSLVLSASSYGLQPWKFIVVKSAEVRAKLLPASFNQTQVIDASHLVVLAIKKDLNASDVEAFVELISSVRQVPKESLEQYKGMMIGTLSRPGFDVNSWASDQLYIALGTILTSAAVLGVDTCPMEGLNPAQYDEILKLDGYATKCVVTLGYRAADDAYASAKKVRWPKTKVVSTIE